MRLHIENVKHNLLEGGRTRAAEPRAHRAQAKQSDRAAVGEGGPAE